MEYPKYYGNYLGIVVQNNDPDRRGRVKVFVPHISPTVYKNWVERDTDVAFRFIGKNINSDLSDVIDDLKKVLPWGEVSMPITGEVASGRYNDTLKYATTSDTNNIDESVQDLDRPPEIGTNIDGTGEKTGAIFDQNAFQLFDAFNNPAETNVNNVNKLSYNYKPETYSNSPKGAFAIPRVGAHVWVFFHEGNPLKPVVFGANYGRDDWRSIYGVTGGEDLGQDYPGEYENFTQIDQKVNTPQELNINAETYRNKYVINQKGGTLQFVNTDNRELLKLTHFSGSFFEMNNQANITLASNNDQKMVIGDSFLTTRGTRNEFTQMDYDNVVQGDHYRKVGDPGRVLLHEEWKKAMDDIADIKQLFDIARCEPVEGIVTSLIKLNSSRQKKLGVPRLCPVCSAIDDGGRDISVNNIFDITDTTGTFGFAIKPQENTIKLGDGAFGSVRAGGQWSVAFNNNTTVNIVGQDPRIVVNKSGAVITDSQDNILPYSPGVVASLPSEPVPCPLCGKGVYPDIGPGQSPSSFGGVWEADPDKLLLNQKYLDVLPKLAEIEAALGKGGSEVIEVEKNKIENIGLVMNNWGAVRVDKFGKMEPAQVQVFPGFTRIVPVPSPLVELVQVDDLPGGTYTLNVANRYSVLVGAGGINMKSYGAVNISGAVTTIAGEQVNIGSASEINVDGGKRLSLVGDVVSIAQRERGQVLVDSDLGVTGQAIIRGSLYVEGPLYVHEIHSVAKASKTNPDVRSGAGYTGEGLPADASPTPMGTIITSDRAHAYKDPKDKSDGVDIGKGGKPVYMGYADKNRAIACAPTGLLLGQVPAAVITGPDLGTVNIVTGTITSLKLPPLLVAALNNILLPTIPAGVVYATPPKSLTEISESIAREQGDEFDMLAALGGEANGTYIPGAGFGSNPEQINLPLRGLPAKAQMRIRVKYSQGDATETPAVVYGDGSDWDAIKMAPGSTTMLTPAVDLEATNAGLRYSFIKNGSIPTCAGHGTNTRKIQSE